MRKFYILLCLLLTFFDVKSQNFIFGDVQKKELQEKITLRDKMYGAVFLFKGRETYFDYDESIGWFLVTKYHERFRVTDQKGMEAATKIIEVFVDGNKREKVSKIKGFTYNLIGGQVHRIALEKEWIFENEFTENRVRHSFTMPQVSVGSIVEWEYKITSPFWKIDDLVLQQDIPVKHYFARIRTPQFFNFKVVKKGYFEIEPRQEIKDRKMGVSWRDKDSFGRTLQSSTSGTLSMLELVREFEMKDIPALKEEPYVDNINNYRYSIIYELESTSFPNQLKKKYSNTWGDVTQAIFDVKDFGGQLQNGKFLKEDVERILDTAKNLHERMLLAFDLIKENYTWNGEMSKFTEQDLDKTYKSKVGNVADINLTLILLLRECGLKANPILLSTRSHGKPIFPTIEGFNYVIAGVQFENEIIFLDATEKLSAPNLLPERVYNGVGRMIEENGSSQKVELIPKDPSRQDILINYQLTKDGSIFGQMRRRFTCLEAMKFRRNFRSKNEYEQYLLEEFKLSKLTDLEVLNMEDLNKPIDEKFSFKKANAFDKVGNSIILSPMTFFTLTKSLFVEEERQFPVNYLFPFETTYTFNIAVPLGFEIKSLPDSSVITFTETGYFQYLINEVSGNIRLRVKFSINNPVIPQDQYSDLQNFYNQMIEKENEKVVLEKKVQ